MKRTISVAKRRKAEAKNSHATNTKEQLRRFEFFDLLVCIAKTLSYDFQMKQNASADKQNMDVASHLESLVQTIQIKHRFRIRYQKFREIFVWTKSVNDLLVQKSDHLAYLYRKTLVNMQSKRRFTVAAA